ncbi:hypothetical protein [Actinoplanes sp. M2I2]|uniref:hypothetical protein n=1 Tax=Actinoplanes sp. M2I2 TaxID=1734444 RepID=UPI0020214698|nr:hypothetical protein [Actinoplanes sp. M2I2]
MRTGPDKNSMLGFGTAGGCVAVVVAALGAAALTGPQELATRLLILAVTAGVLARFLADWRAGAAVTVFAALTFVGFLAHQQGDLVSDVSPWPYTVLIGFAAVLGRGQRWMHEPPRAAGLPRR